MHAPANVMKWENIWLCYLPASRSICILDSLSEGRLGTICLSLAKAWLRFIVLCLSLTFAWFLWLMTSSLVNTLLLLVRACFVLQLELSLELESLLSAAGSELICWLLSGDWLCGGEACAWWRRGEYWGGDWLRWGEYGWKVTWRSACGGEWDEKWRK